jgi:hypothetical protein
MKIKVAYVVLLTVFALGCGGYGSGNGGGMGGSASNISALVPNSTTAGDPAFTLTVNGSGFTNSAVVFWNGESRTTHFVTAGQITADISAADVASAGMVSVHVHTPGGIYNNNGFNSNSMSFTVN